MFLLLQIIVFALPGQAETKWDDISGSINDSFSGNQAFSIKNITVFAFAILIFYLVFVIVRIYWAREEKEYSQKRRGRHLRRTSARHQLRSWFRLMTNNEFEWVTAEKALISKKILYKKDRLVDLSGGGLCFLTEEKLNSGDELKLLLNTGGGKPLSLSGHVVRIIEEAGPDKVMYKVAVQFGKMLSGDRDKIISVIMNRQRESIQEKKQEDMSV